MKTLKLLSMTLLLSGLIFNSSKAVEGLPARDKEVLSVEQFMSFYSEENLVERYDLIKVYNKYHELGSSFKEFASKDGRFVGSILHFGLSKGNGYKRVASKTDKCLNVLYIRDKKDSQNIIEIRAVDVVSFVFSENSKFVFIEFSSGCKIIYDLSKRKEIAKLSKYIEYNNDLVFYNLVNFNLSVDFSNGSLVFYDKSVGVKEIGKFENVDHFCFLKRTICDKKDYKDYKVEDFEGDFSTFAYIVIFFKDGSIKHFKAEDYFIGVVDTSCDEHPVCLPPRRNKLTEVAEFKSATKNK